MVGIIIGMLEQGFIFAIVALGCYISFKILNFPDMSVDGTYPLGAAITAILVVMGVNPWIACLASFLGGMLAGFVTGFIHVKFGISDLLSGILVMTALYSVNIRIAGRSNLPFFTKTTIFKGKLASMIPAGISTLTVLIIVFIIALIVKLILDWYLKTKSGFLIKATGDNEQLVTSLSKSSGTYKIIGLAVANGLAALGGAVMCQYQNYFDVNMGTGTMVIGLASVIIGMTIFRKVKFMKATTMVLIGSIIYKACVTVAINLGFKSEDMKLITAVIFLIALILNGKLFRRKKNVEAPEY